MKRQCIVLTVLTALFMGFSIQASQEEIQENPATQRSMYERMKAMAQSGYEGAKGLIGKYAPSLYSKARGLVEEYAPTIQEFAKNFIEKHVIPRGQEAVKAVVRQALLSDSVDKLLEGVPFGNELVDEIRTAYMSTYFPNYTKTFTVDAEGKKTVQWAIEEKVKWEEIGKESAIGGKPMIDKGTVSTNEK